MHASRRFRTLLAPLLLCLLPSAAMAEDAASPSASFLRELTGMCPEFVKELVADPEIRALVADRPNFAADVCLCTSASIAKDQRMRDRLDRIPEEAEPDAAMQRMQSYLFLRLMSSLLQCASTEFEAVLATVQIDAPAAGKGEPAAPAKP